MRIQNISFCRSNCITMPLNSCDQSHQLHCHHNAETVSAPAPTFHSISSNSCSIKVAMDTLQTREHTFQAKAAAEFSKLRSLQAELEAETGQACFLGLSAADTLRQCVRLGNHRAAAKIRQELKITDKRFWWIKVRALLSG